MITFRQFEVIRAVMHSGTVTEAARVLGITQPAVSRLLRHTEDRLGLSLFIRGRGRLRPSEAAWTLFPFIEKLFESLEAAQRSAGELHREHSQRLRIVSIPSIAACVLPGAINRLQQRFGRAEITLRTLANFEVASAVASGQADIGFVFVPPSYPDLESFDLGAMPIMAAIRSDDPLANRELLTVDDMRRAPLISLSASLPIGAALEESARRHLVDLRLTIEVSDSFSACSLANAGLGVALVDALSIKLPNLVARPIEIAPHVQAKALLAAGHRPRPLVKNLLDEMLQGPEWVSGIDLNHKPDPPGDLGDPQRHSRTAVNTPEKPDRCC